MQISGIVIKEKLENEKSGQTTNAGKVQAVMFENQYRDAAVLEKSTGHTKEYNDIDVTQKQPEEKNPLQISMEAIQTLADSVTPEDYSAYAELGLAPEADDPAKLVTVSDRIKIEMALNCDDYTVYGDIDMDMIKSVYGDSTVAYSIAASLNEHNIPVTANNIDAVNSALEMAQDLGNISEESREYILNNNLSLSVENIYISQYAKPDNDMAIPEESITDVQWDSLKQQVERMLNEAGVDITADNLNNARWMVENKIPVTVDNIRKMSVMTDFSGNMSREEWIDTIVSFMALGGKAADTPVMGTDTFQETVQELIDTVDSVTDEELQQIIKQNYILNVKNFERVKNEKGEETFNEDIPKQDVKLIKARRQVEEIRLMMTVSAGVKMMMKGISIDTEPMENIIKELKQQENQYAGAMFENAGFVPEEDDINLFKTVTDSMEILKSTPVYVLGNVLSGETEFEPQAINEKGTQIKAKLIEAGEAYETMRTQPRKDLGDSLKKAFESVDGILESMDIEITESSQRAVRVLTYNNMDLTKENIISIKQLDMEVTRLMDNMTPKTVVHLISNGINPLDTNIKVLNDELDNINNQINADYGEKYSEYLWRLQNDNSITEEERDAYIGVYRLLNMVAKGDRSVIGALVNEGAEITMNNMLHAVRSRKAEGIDVSVDEKLGLTEEIRFDENSISSQLEGFMQSGSEGGSTSSDEQRYWQQMVKEVLEQVTPQKLSGISKEENIFNMPFEKFADNIMQYSEAGDSEYQMKYYEQHINDMQQAVKNVSEEVFQSLMDSEQVATVENVMAASFVMSDNGKIFNKIKKYDEDGNIKDKVNKISEFDGDEEELQECYDSIEAGMEKVLDNYIISGKKEEIDEIIRLKKSFKLLSAMGRREMYHIPVEINGETAGIRVTIIKNSSEKGKVTADIRSDVLGKISAEFTVSGKKVDGIIVADSDETVTFLEGAVAEFERSLEDEGYITESVNNAKHENIHYGMWSFDEGRDDKVSNSDLYKVAKLFISNVKEWGKSLIINE